MEQSLVQKRAVAFFDGQNLYHAARESFGYTYPNYNPLSLAQRICDGQGWELTKTRFYTRIPDLSDNAFWHHFWASKGRWMRSKGIHVFTRPLRYRSKTVKLHDGSEHALSYWRGKRN